MKLMFVALLAFFGVAPLVFATNTYDYAKNQLTIDSLTLGDTTYTNVVVTVGSVVKVGGSSPAVVPVTCTASNINAASFNAIQVGMTYEQVTAAIGCKNDVSLTTRSSTYVQYWWTLYPGSISTGIRVFFDGAGAIVTPFAGTIKSSFGI